MANYHVNYLTGSNTTGNGTAGNPWATVAFAMTSATSGDVIKVAATGTTQVLSTTASWTSDTAISTGVDLTSQVAVGDIIIINPKYAGNPEFDGWAMFEARTITSTSIDFGSIGSRFSNRSSAQFEIVKFTSFVNAGASGDFESLVSFTTTKGGVLIEGGYNDTFTSVVGYTNIFRTGLGQNATAGTCFRTSGGSAGDGYNLFPMLKNFRFSKFADVLTTTVFGVNVPMDNIMFYGINRISNASMPYNPLDNSGAGQGTIYISNCPGFSKQYYDLNNATGVKLKAGYKVNLYINSGQKGPTVFTNIDFNNVYVINNAANSNGAVFGINAWARLMSCRFTGVYKWTGRAGNSELRPTIVFGAGNKWMPSSYTRITDSAAPYYTAFATAPGLTPITPHYIKLPTGLTINDLGTTASCISPSSNDQNSMNGTVVATVIDNDGKLWNNMPDGTFVTEDTVEYSTGTSSKKVRLSANGYSSLQPYIQLGVAARQKSGQTLQSVTVRYKMTSGIPSSQLRLAIECTQNFDEGLLSAPLNVAPVTSWTDRTFTISYTEGKGANIFQSYGADAIFTFYLYYGVNIQTTASEYIWIDSVTFNYA